MSAAFARDTSQESGALARGRAALKRSAPAQNGALLVRRFCSCRRSLNADVLEILAMHVGKRGA
jgi:hypothetical protein